MVHQHQIRAELRGGIQQGLAGRHPADHARDLRATLHLQAVGAVVGEAPRLQQVVGVGNQLLEIDRHKDIPGQMMTGSRLL